MEYVVKIQKAATVHFSTNHLPHLGFDRFGFNPFSTGTDFKRQILTSKFDPRSTERVNIYNSRADT